MKYCDSCSVGEGSEWNKSELATALNGSEFEPRQAKHKITYYNKKMNVCTHCFNMLKDLKAINA